MLSNTQERIERSLFEAIRKVLVLEQYLPDITLYNEPWDAADTAQWKAELAAIIAAKGFAIEIFNNSATESKGMKKVPRIVISPGQSMPGDLGATLDGIIQTDPLNPNGLVRLPMPLQSTHFHMDIHLASNSAKQDRKLNAIIAKALGKKKFVEFYDQPGEYFLVLQYNYFDIPDPTEGIEERVYSYQIPDVYDTTEDYQAVTKINQITVEPNVLSPGATLNEDLSLQSGTLEKDEDLIKPQP